MCVTKEDELKEDKDKKECEKEVENEKICKKDKVKDIHSSVRNVLATGLITSITIITIGFLMMFFSGEESEKIMPFSKMAWSILEFKPLAVLSLGILILLLTPLARVFMTSVIFYKEKDYKYVVISVIVIVVLLASLLLGAK